MPEGPRSGAFWHARLMYFYSGSPMHFYSDVDTARYYCVSKPTMPRSFSITGFGVA
jgi:hypothetical protein